MIAVGCLTFRQSSRLTLLLLSLAACAAAPEQDARLVLGANSTAQIEAWNICARMENSLPKNTELYVPISTPEGWSAFTAIPSREGGKIRMLPCASSQHS